MSDETVRILAKSLILVAVFSIIALLFQSQLMFNLFSTATVAIAVILFIEMEGWLHD